jgi:hypothetical protein
MVVCIMIRIIIGAWGMIRIIIGAWGLIFNT